MRIGIDVDGVLADFNSKYIDKIVKMSGRDLFPSHPFVIPKWNYPEYYGYTRQEIDAVWESIKTDDRFWESLAAFPETSFFLACIATAQRLPWYDVYFITARPGRTAKKQTERWLRPFLMNAMSCYPTVLIASDKAALCKALDLDVYIDDRWSNVISVAENCRTQAYLLDRSWNHSHKDTDGEIGNGYVRLASVNDFLPCIEPSYLRSA